MKKVVKDFSDGNSERLNFYLRQCFFFEILQTLDIHKSLISLNGKSDRNRFRNCRAGIGVET